MKNTTKKPAKFHVGQFVFYAFRLCEIVEMKDDRVVEVSDGYVRIGSSDHTSEIFPLDLKGKRISDHFHSEKERLRAEVPGHLNLNWPDISRCYEAHWLTTMECREDDKAVADGFNRASSLTNDLIAGVRELRARTVHGIHLLRK